MDTSTVLLDQTGGAELTYDWAHGKRVTSGGGMRVAKATTRAVNALTLRTRWLRPFGEVMLDSPQGADHTSLGLRRGSVLLDRIGVAATPDGHVTD